MAGDGVTAASSSSRGGEAVEPQYAAAKTSVWWDIENCQVPRGCDPHTIAQNISAALMKMNYFGPVTISAYGDTNRIPSSVQQALSSTGIALNHVPAGVKDASDKKILVEMLFWAVDNPAPANYLLISGDRDFSNAIHQLRMRRYNILLAQPFKASVVLAAAAKNVWQWTTLAAGGSPREHTHRANTIRQESTLTPITEPISTNEPAYSDNNGNASTNASKPQRLSNPAYSNNNANAITNASGPHTLSNPAYSVSNANASTKASDTQRLSNPAYSDNNTNAITSASVPQRLSNTAYSDNNANAIINASVPQRLSNPAYSGNNANASTNASGPQRLSNTGRPINTKTKAIYVPKNLNQLNMAGMSCTLVRIEETSSSHCSLDADVAAKPFAPHHFFAKPDISENSSSKFIENEDDQSTESQPPLVLDNFMPLNSRQNSLQPVPTRPEGFAVSSTPFVRNPDAGRGRGDICGSLRNGHTRPEFCSASCSSEVSKSVSGNSVMGNLVLQLPEHIQGLIEVILLALNTLRLEKIVPTTENITDCIHFGNPKYHHIDVTAALNAALEQKMILKKILGQKEIYVGRTERLWECVNPIGGNPNQYQNATWNVIEKFVCSTVGRSAIAASKCRYDAALILRNACLKDLTLGEVLQILDVIIRHKRWIKHMHDGWQPVVITLPETNNDMGTKTGT